MTFNEGSRIDSSRVQRRGRSVRRGSGIAIGGGGLGLVVLVAFLLLGGDPAALTTGELAGGAGQDPAIQQQYQDECETGADANQSSDCRVAGGVNSLDAYWGAALADYGVELDYPGIVAFDGATSTACGQATSSTGPFYCPSDQTIYLDVVFYQVLADDYGSSDGPLAELYVLAHEYGHHIENQLGVFDVAQRVDTGTDSDSVKVELMADCFAGVWAGHASTVADESGTPFLQPLTPTDVADAMSAAAAVGDDSIQEAAQGSVDPDSFTHGTSQQRQDQFELGYSTGDPARCDTFNVFS
ncbi:KPN_02809 family neutral zinc metallopeptidase [Demequina oxidasica]|uniref:KPN_02809 family neutral zinc metallopeptidase n=1 Tax=Demequina oxidasica TaxID=676199 RepID=UPI00078625E7|nr:neutral zinc metallopeptidase [Demequina oxidasica]